MLANVKICLNTANIADILKKLYIKYNSQNIVIICRLSVTTAMGYSTLQPLKYILMPFQLNSIKYTMGVLEYFGEV